MRRSDREIKEYNEIIGVIEKCDVCRLALNNDGYPYIIPLNFGFKEENGKAELYFHCANEGTKLELIKKEEARTEKFFNTGNFLLNKKASLDVKMSWLAFCFVDYLANILTACL